MLELCMLGEAVTHMGEAGVRGLVEAIRYPRLHSLLHIQHVMVNPGVTVRLALPLLDSHAGLWVGYLPSLHISNNMGGLLW